jgi:multiple sugar transport system permease protein
LRKKKKYLLLLRYLTLCILALMFLIPVLWMIISSLKEPLHIFTRPIEWIPKKPHFENYLKLFTYYHFEQYVWNTIKLCLLNVVGTVASCSLIAYGFAYGKYKHKNKLFFIVLLTMMLPGTVTFFPQFILFTKIGWYGTLLPLWLPSFLGNAYFIFFLRQYFLTIPKPMMDSAKLDGCGHLKTLLYVVIPMSRPVYIVMVLNTFINVWGDFFNQLIYITKSENYTISMGLTALNSSYGKTNNSTLPMLMAGSFIVSIPVLFIYYLGQKTMIKTYVFKGVDK